MNEGGMMPETGRIYQGDCIEIMHSWAVSEGDTSMTVRLITGFGDPVMVISKDCLYGEKYCGGLQETK